MIFELRYGMQNAGQKMLKGKQNENRSHGRRYVVRGIYVPVFQ